MADNPHDAFFKVVFSRPEHAAGELRAVLSSDLADRIAWSTLALTPGSFVDEALAQSHTDLLFTAKLDGREALIYFLFEHLSTVEPLAAFRLLRYEVRIWEQWLIKHPLAKKLPPIVSVVVHHSDTGWTGTTCFEDLIDADGATLTLLGHLVPRFRFELDDVSRLTDEQLRRRATTALGTVALWCFRDVRKPGVLIRDLVRWFDLLRAVLRAPGGAAAIHAVLRYIAVTTQRLDRQQFQDTVRRLVAPIEDMMDTLQDQIDEYFMEAGIARGMEKGIEKGIEKGGIEKGRREMLLRQLRRRFGDVPESVTARLAEAKVAQLDSWSDRILSARTLEEVFAED